MRCEVVAVGTELLLGQIVDTNSSWIGERLAAHGIDSHFQTKVGDNLDRIVAALRLALERSDAVVVCGGLGPTHDDITRLALAQVMGVELVRDEAVLDRIRSMFESRGRTMPPSNAVQADVPVGAAIIEQRRGTAPGLIGSVAGGKVIYVVPGVPHEMIEMMERVVLADMVERSGQRAVIASRVLRTWGESESALADLLGPHIATLDETGAECTLAFLASGIEGIKVRVTAKGPDRAAVDAMLDTEEAVLRSLLGSLVFGVDDQTMEYAVGAMLVERGWTLGLAESMTGGLVAMRMTAVPEASTWFRGGVVSYASEVKFDLLEVPQGPVVSEESAAAMASGARKLLDADVGLSVTGVAGPSEQDGQPVGTVWLGCDLAGEVHTHLLQASNMGGREQIRQIAAISLSDFLRRLLR
ncbi:MAG: competence/damage-inducible protein A [Actinobacteria bacterium]|nr:competence/damage-inducible protein A [Actinomycetota bacterium]